MIAISFQLSIVIEIDWNLVFKIGTLAGLHVTFVGGFNVYFVKDSVKTFLMFNFRFWVANFLISFRDSFFLTMSVNSEQSL